MMNSQSGAITMLLVEDSEDDAFFFRWTLQKTGLVCHCEHVVDGQKAIEFLEAHRHGRLPDIIFLDLKMPGMSGFDVLGWIRDQKLGNSLNITVLSGSDHEADVRLARELGARHYLVKPISDKQLIERLSNLIGQRNPKTPVRDEPEISAQ